ncbi:MAG: DUF885 family protein, partial [Deltaproteobacteria bacterium]|nr:DUF885 family protein [Deltaproteobacteria bacterium]
MEWLTNMRAFKKRPHGSTSIIGKDLNSYVSVMNNFEKRPLHSVAKDFFSYLGKHLPQQCASDEFYFFPRSEFAIQYLDNLDDFNPEKIQDHIRYVQGLLNEIPPDELDNLEKETDRIILKQSMESFIREFQDEEVWKKDPTLYLKIPFLATDHIISQADSSPVRLKESLLTLFTRIPSFLNLSFNNLRSLSEISLVVALGMTRDALYFYNHDIRAFIEEKLGSDKILLAENTKVLQAWEQYRERLLHIQPVQSFAIGENSLKKILSTSLNYPKSCREIQEIAQHAYHKTIEKLNGLAKKIDSNRSWEAIIYDRPTSASSQIEILQLYKREVQNLRRFFNSMDIITFPSEENISVLETPSYLQTLRATASYKAPLTGITKGHGIFYITPGKERLELISNHCPYLSAHETYPGHHILDHIRIHHPNPIRRQIESPLFYEGWACYAEQLLDELGYVCDPRQQLVGLKRQLWRCLRAVLDVELQTGKITLTEGAKKIEEIGFSSGTARRQI